MTIPAPWPCRNRWLHSTPVLAALSATLLLIVPLEAAANANPETSPPSPLVCDDSVPATVIIDAGEVTNSTVVELSADGGTAIADASGGDRNVAVNGGSAGNGGVMTSSAGNGGVSTSSADGGTVSIGDINSGGNAGNAIAVGDTFASPIIVPSAPEVSPAPRPVPHKPVPVLIPDEPRPGKRVVVIRLPSTGVAITRSGLASGATLLALLTGYASLAVRRRFT